MATVEDIAKILAGHFASRPWETMAPDRAALRKLVRNPFDGDYDINEPTREDCLHAARDVLDATA